LGVWQQLIRDYKRRAMKARRKRHSSIDLLISDTAVPSAVVNDRQLFVPALSRNLRDVSKINVYTNVFGLDYPPYHKASVAKTITEIPAVPIR
jgi:hypothetical protein